MASVWRQRSEQFLLLRVFDLGFDFVSERLGDAARHLQLRGRGSAVEGHFEADA
jgi:hypothetical protein